MKKSANFLLKTVCILSLLLFGMYACTNGNNQQKEQTISPAQEGHSANANRPSGKKWPVEIPSDVPQFEYGSLTEIITNHTSENLTWILKYSGTTNSDIAAYETTLKKAGLKPSTMPMGNGDMIVSGKGSLTVTVNYLETTATVGVNQKR